MSPLGAVLFVVAVGGALAGTAPLPDRLRALERIPAWAVPAGVAVVALATGTTHPDQLGGWLGPLAPALAFLLAGVPLAVLLDRRGFFDATAALVAARSGSVLGLWIVAALTTALLNLDTTVVLLTPLYIRLARRTGQDVVALAAIPFLLANLASMALPVSNLTTLIASEQWSVAAGEVFVRVGLPTVAASIVGWFAYRRRWPGVVTGTAPGAGTDDLDDHPIDRTALIEGGVIVAGVLVGFVAGPIFGVPAWAVALTADVILMIRLRIVPWRALPLDSAALVLSLAIVTAAALPDGLASMLPTGGFGADAATLGLGVLLANAVNNLPALLAGIHGTTAATATGWSWLVGVSLGPVLTPLGSLANMLWWRSAQEQGVAIRARDVVRIGVRVGGPALLAGAAVFLALQAVLG